VVSILKLPIDGGDKNNKIKMEQTIEQAVTNGW
jgi:hypothetical protein